MDASFGGVPEFGRGITGYIFLYNGTPISWCSKAQARRARATTEAEYVAMSMGSSEAVWIRSLLGELQHAQLSPTELRKVKFFDDVGTNLFSDSQSAIKLAKNPVYHDLTKHIDIKWDAIRELIEEKEIEVKFIPGDFQKADVFTKALSGTKLNRVLQELNIIPCSVSTS